MMNLLFLFAIILYFIKPNWPILFWLVVEPFLAPFMVLLLGITGIKETADFVYVLNSGFSRVFLPLILFLFFIKRRPIPNKISSIITPLVLLLVYLVLHNVIIHFDLIVMYRDVSGAIYSSIPLFFFLLDKRARPTTKQLYVVIMIVYLVELIWIPINLEGIYAYAGRYEEVLRGFEEANLMPGTFFRSNRLSDFVAITYFFILCDYFFRKSLPKGLFLITTVIAIILLLFAGSKTPIIAVFLTFMLILVLCKKRMLAFSLIISLLAIVFIIVPSSDIFKGQSSNEGMNRIVEGISDFAKTKSKGETDYSTFGLSTALIDSYFHKSPLIGCGYSYKGEDKAYPLRNHSADDLSLLISDATFAYYLVEFGLIGMFLYLLYYYSLIKYACKFYIGDRNKLILSVFFFFLLLSITEGGIFVVSYFWYILTYLFSNGDKSIGPRALNITKSPYSV